MDWGIAKGTFWGLLETRSWSSSWCWSWICTRAWIWTWSWSWDSSWLVPKCLLDDPDSFPKYKKSIEKV